MARPKLPKNGGGTPPAITSSESTSFDTVESPVESMAAASPATEVRKAKSTRTTRKPKFVGTESRANLVPINLDDEIRSLAYLLAERRGFEPGHETEDWLNAEREVLGRYQQQRA